MPEVESYIVMVQIEYTEGDPDNYLLPVALARGEDAARVEAEFQDTLVARVRAKDGAEGVLYGAVWNPRFRDALLGAMARRRRLRGRRGELVGSHSRALRRVWGASHPNLESTVGRAEQSNTSMMFGDRFILKLFRKVEAGVNPDVEISSMLSDAGFPSTPAFCGHIEYRRNDGEVTHVAILQELVKNEGDAWKYTLDSLSQYYEAALARPEPPPVPEGHPLALMNEDSPLLAQDMMGAFLESARLLGQRTAEMHLALAKGTGPEFEPEPFTDHYRHGLHHGFIQGANRSAQMLRKQLPKMNETAALAQAVLDRDTEIKAKFAPMRSERIGGMRIRHHGDYHLGQVLYTGKDFSIIDFEGEPARSLSERRLKRSPLRDVSGMLRSFQYASYSALYGMITGLNPTPERLPVIEQWAGFWSAWVSAAYLKGYFDRANGAPFLPSDVDQTQILLDVYTLDKALYEVRYELNNRPDWVRIPLLGIIKLLGA
jgi:maltose alpha-D-glucosyltransferase/alpha-amylase